MNGKVSARLTHLRALANDNFIDVTVPVIIRFWAGSNTDALAQLSDCEIEIQGPMHSFSVGFPECKEVDVQD